MAALSHAGILLFGWGIILPVIVWTTQREKSRFANFQALQALAYQIFSTLFYYFISFVVIPPMAILLAFGITLLEERSPEAFAYLFPMGMVLVLLTIFGLTGLYALIGLIGAVACLTGRNFRYPLLGKWLERYLDSEPMVEVVEDDA